MTETSMQKHIRCQQGDIAPRVLLPGDPERARRIADQLDSVEKISENREYVVYTGVKEGVDISVCSTGIGGPSAAIALEELAHLRAETFIRVGSAGGRQEDIPIGSTVILDSAVRDGTSREYLPVIYPAVADFEVTLALKEAVSRMGEEVYIGTSFTRDAFYEQNQYLNQEFKNTRVVASEMECATLFIVGAKRGLKVGAIVGTDSNILQEKQLSLAEKDRLYMQAEKRTIRAAIRALISLSKNG